MRVSVGKKIGGVYAGTSVSGNSLLKAIYWFFAWPFYLLYYILVWPFVKLYQRSKKKIFVPLKQLKKLLKLTGRFLK